MQIAQKAPVATRLAKEAVLKTFDTSLEEGLQFERRNFYLLFSTQDMKEGMKAFSEKRPPQFKGRCDVLRNHTGREQGSDNTSHPEPSRSHLLLRRQAGTR